MRRLIPLLSCLVLSATVAGQQAPPKAAPGGEKPFLVLDSGGHSATVKKVLFLPGGQEVLTVSLDKTVRVWDIATGEAVRVFRLPLGPADEGGLYAAAVSANGKTLAVAGFPYGRGKFGILIYLIALETGQVQKVLKGHTNIVNSLDFSADGKKLASSSGDGTARVWDVASGKMEQVLQGHTSGVRQVVFAPDGKRLATTSNDKTSKLWTLATGKSDAVLQEGNHPPLSIAWSPDGKTIAVGHLDATISLYNPDGKHRQTFPGIRNQVVSLVFTPDSKEILFTGVGYGAGNELEFGSSLLDVATGKERVRCQLHRNTVMHGSVSPDGKLAASTGGDNHETFVWRISDGSVVQKLQSRGESVWAVGWSPDGKSIAWGNTNRAANSPLEQTFELLPLDFGDPPAKKPFSQAELRRGNRILAFGPDFQMVVKDGDKGVHTFQPPFERERIYSFTWLGDERVVVGGSNGLWLYDPTAKKIVKTFEGHAGLILAVAPSPDGRYFLTGSTDQTLSIWDPNQTAPLILFFFAERDWIAWTPEGVYAASGNGERLMGWLINNGPEAMASFHPAGRFRRSLYHPDVIRQVVAAGSLAKAFTLAGKKQPDVQGVMQLLPPAAVITAPAGAGSVKLTSGKVEVKATAKSAGKNPVTALRLLVDGRPYKGEAGLQKFPQPKLGDVQGKWTVELPPGGHTLAVQAESAVSKSLSATVDVSVPGKVDLPVLHILAVGINDYPAPNQLNYAASDADAITRALQEKAGKAFAKVDVKLIKDKAATRAEVMKGLDWLGSVMTPQDVGIFFFSGHGDRDRDGTFYLVPVDVGRDTAKTCVSGDHIKKTLGNMPGRLIAMLDACHSGAAAGPRTNQRSADDLVRDLVTEEYAVIVMCSSLGREYSLESGETKAGFFTLALLEGLAGKADANGDGAVFLNELDLYAVRRVRQLSENMQNPVTAKPATLRWLPLTKQ